MADKRVHKGQSSTTARFALRFAGCDILDWKVSEHGGALDDARIAIRVSWKYDEPLTITLTMKIDVNILTDNRETHRRTSAIVLRTGNHFQIKGLDNINIVENPIDIPRDIASRLIDLSYSTARGIFIARLQETPYQNFVLPIINARDLLLQ